MHKKWKNKAVDLLRQLSEAHGAPGHEEAVRKIVFDELKSRVDTDKSGNVICYSPGNSPNPCIMLEAHMDEVGFMVQNITDEGYLQIVELGGWWPQTLLSQRVRILTREGMDIQGIITCKPPHFLSPQDRAEVIAIDKMFVDIGARDKEEVIKTFRVSLGDTVVPFSPFTPIQNSSLYMGKAFDNRVGVALLIQATQILRQEPHPNNLISVASVQEEVGTRGIQSALNTVNPDVAIVLEGAPADDFPGASPGNKQGILGNGVQIRLMDSSAIMSRPFSNFAIDLAKTHSIAHQIAVRRSGGTDAKGVLFHSTGVPTIVLAIPARYIHTHNSIIDIDDYLESLRLIIELVQQVGEDIVTSFTTWL